MTYCQECGAANDPGNPTCRICGRALQYQRSTLRCSACGQFVGVGASFCTNCGAASDDLAFGAPADGGTPPSAAAIEAMVVTAAAPRSATPPQPAPEPDTGLNLGAGLELPDWLKRAAAETPRQPPTATVAGIDSPASFAAGTAATATQPPSTVAPQSLAATAAPIAATPAPPTAQPATGGSLLRRLGASQAAVATMPAISPAAGVVALTDPVAPEETALPPLPDGGLAQSLPAWLRPGTGPSGAGPVAAPAAPAPPRPSEDPTDTASFISENDLPAWLRQLAETEAAQAEEARLAEEASLVEAAAQAAVAASQAAEAAARAATEDEAVALAAADGGAAVGQPGAAGPWLARHDQDDPTTGRRTAFADLVSERAAEADAYVEAAPTQSEAAEMGAFDRAAMTTTVAATKAKVAASEKAAVERDAKRWMVIGVLILLIALLLAYLFVTGSFG